VFKIFYSLRTYYWDTKFSQFKTETF